MKITMEYHNLFDSDTNILMNISSTVDDLLRNAELLDGVNSTPLTDDIKRRLNETYLMPPTRSIKVESPDLDGIYMISAPNNWQYGLNYWQLLAGFDAFFKSYMRKYNTDDINAVFGDHIYWEGLSYIETDKNGIPIYHLSLGS
jgi:hypothetical protein